MTRRQSQIMELLVQGFSNKEIAMHLGVSDNTIKMHLQRMYLRNGVGSRGRLVAKALREAKAVG